MYYICMHVYVCVCSVISDSLQPFELEPARLLCPWDFSGKNIRVEVPKMYRSQYIPSSFDKCMHLCNYYLV